MLRVPDVIVSSNWLHKNLNNPKLIILDATIPKVGQTEDDISLEEFIPNTIFFDLKNVFSDQKAAFPNTILDPMKFQLEARKLGIKKDSCIVVYDRHGIYSSPRAWWIFKTMGFENIAVLDGGFSGWKKQVGILENETKPILIRGDFHVHFQANLVSRVIEISESLQNENISIIDARDSKRFQGLIEEPRPRLRCGHIPGSKNLPYVNLLKNGFLKPKEELESYFSEFTKSEKVIFSCGSGITACINALAFCSLGNSNFSVYDGSWTEWGSDSSLPISTSYD